MNFNKSIKIKRAYVSLYILFLLIIFYTFFDLQNSASIGIKEAERGTVYIFLISIISLLVIYLIGHLKDIRLSIFSITLILLTFWILFVNIIQEAPIWTSGVHIGLSFWWLVTYLFFRTFLSNNGEAYREIRSFIQVMVVIYFVASIYASFKISSTYEVIATVNLVYYMIIFLPFILLINSKYKKINSILIILIVMISMKRGALIVFPLMMIAYYSLEGVLKRYGLSYFLKMAGLLIAFLISFKLIDRFTDGYLLSRFSKESLADGSGRNEIFATAINNISNRSLIDFLIGKGSGSSITSLGTGAHNEWLEFMFNFGLVGTILYTVLCFSILIKGIKLFMRGSSNASSYNIMLIYITVVGMFGGIYFVHSTFYVFAFYGIVDSIEFNNKTRKYKLEANKKEIGCG
ncbi:hypothetical protein CSV80_15940 [Sporosarcina sp. P12(2017)]|uniref:O-antigen ligase family protein n=1 Tax=unclassified Sporosarcina TaxID=2647733 RepID=UPI000C16FDB8|nr:MULTISPECIES: O-antigen ligase family protein [unclassified Sporosarcina]PIC56155.1 hypothetical protein CSV81_15945 [Sporosarcina sp. P10]PIC59483.1 hypothetical protein CSV80_15940 [Sporosarcina sp. P12(2017)]